MKLTRLPLACAFFACASASAPCFAQARDPAAAEALFRDGRKDLESNQYQEACQKFGESQRLDPAAGTLMNLATCEEKLGRLASAWQHWKEAIDALPSADERVGFARARMIVLETRLPKLTVVLVADSDAGARIFRDDIELGKASRSVPLPVDPGPHAVTVQMAGRMPASVAFTVGEEELKTVEVRPGPIDPEAAPWPERERPWRNAGWVLGGAGLAGLGTAVVTGVIVAGKKSTAEARCPHKVCTTQVDLSAVSSGRALLSVNTAAWIVGVLGLGAGAYLVFAKHDDGGAVGLAPAIGPASAGVSCEGRF